MFNLKQIGGWLIENKLMDKPFSQFSETEITDLCHQVVDSITDTYITAPRLEEDELIIPATVHKKYRWWAGGQSLFDTLEEIGAPARVIEKYCPAKDREGMKKDD